MSTVEGTGQLMRLIIRLDRVRLTVWALALAAIPLVVASSFAALYDTEAARLELVTTVASSPGLVALLGPIGGTSVGALTVWRIGTIGGVFVALMSAFTVIRHTRLDEETGRRELLGSTVIGRHAPLLSAVAVAALAGVVVGVVLALGLIGIGEAVSGAVAFGASWMLLAVLFAAIGGLAAQLTETTGGGRGIVVACIGVFYALRMAGDGAGPGGLEWLSWLSPFGWVTRMEPFGEEQWWVSMLFLGLVFLVGWAAFAISGARDVGAGVIPPRPGPPTAAPHLRSATGLAWRLHRGAVLGWSVGIALFAVVWGGLADTLGDLFEENPQLADIFEALGGTGALTEVFFAAAMGIVALIVSGYSIGAALRMQSEENGLRAEHILATPTPRLNWAGSHVLYALVGPVLLMALAGLAAGATYGAITGDIAGWMTDLFESALLYVPAIWVLAGIAVLLYGLAPRFTALSWGVLVASLLLGQLGPILQLPQWSMDLSPFTHVPTPPESVSTAPLLLLTAVGGSLVAIGVRGFERRDLR